MNPIGHTLSTHFGLPVKRGGGLWACVGYGALLGWAGKWRRITHRLDVRMIRASGSEWHQRTPLMALSTRRMLAVTTGPFGGFGPPPLDRTNLR